MEIQIHKLSCQRCSYQWVPRKTEVRVCPKCHSPYWDKNRLESVNKQVSHTETIKEILNEIVRRIVKACNPEKIILFGSHATGRAGPESDVDLLVVMGVKGSRREKATEIDTKLYGIPLPVDVIVITPHQLEQARDLAGSIVQTAVSEGKTVYERAA